MTDQASPQVIPIKPARIPRSEFTLAARFQLLVYNLIYGWWPQKARGFTRTFVRIFLLLEMGNTLEKISAAAWTISNPRIPRAQQPDWVRAQFNEEDALTFNPLEPISLFQVIASGTWMITAIAGLLMIVSRWMLPEAEEAQVHQRELAYLVFALISWVMLCIGTFIMVGTELKADKVIGGFAIGGIVGLLLVIIGLLVEVDVAATFGAILQALPIVDTWMPMSCFGVMLLLACATWLMCLVFWLRQKVTRVLTQNSNTLTWNEDGEPTSMSRERISLSARVEDGLELLLLCVSTVLVYSNEHKIVHSSKHAFGHLVRAVLQARLDDEEVRVVS